jgi:hypothetical protein
MYTRMSPRLTFGFSVLVFFGKAEILPLGRWRSPMSIDKDVP